MNTHIQRWMTAAVAVPLLLLIIGFGSEAVFALFIIVVVLAAMVEYNSLVFEKGRRMERAVTLIASFFVLTAAFTGGPPFVLATLTFVIPGLFSLSLLRPEKVVSDLKTIKDIFFGLFFISVMISHFILIRGDDRGVEWVFFIIVMAFSSDVAAYYIGRTLGRRKLVPSVSVGKTVEGAVGGMAGCIAGCILYVFMFLPDVGPGHAVVMGFLGSVFGMIGDLSESIIKRASRAKDSGSLLPGHGGVLDRLDSFIFMAPFVYYYKLFVAIP